MPQEQEPRDNHGHEPQSGLSDRPVNDDGYDILEDEGEEEGMWSDDEDNKRNVDAFLNDEVGLYLQEIRKEPLLTADEEVALAQRIERGKEASERITSLNTIDEETHSDLLATIEDSKEARDHLGRANTRLVVSIAKRFQGRGLSFLDLIQDGNVGLMKAVDKYDWHTGNRFSTYAIWWIKQSIRRSIAEKSRMVKIPIHRSKAVTNIYAKNRELELALGRQPSEKEIADAAKLPFELVRDINRANQSLVSLDIIVGDGDAELIDFVENEHAERPDDVTFHNQRIMELQKALQTLSPRQREVLELHYGLRDGKTHSFEAIGRLFGRSRERIRQIDYSACKKLERDKRFGPILREFLAEDDE